MEDKKEYEMSKWMWKAEVRGRLRGHVELVWISKMAGNIGPVDG